MSNITAFLLGVTSVLMLESVILIFATSWLSNKIKKCG